MILFIDTNILLDVIFNRQPFLDDAKKIFSMVSKEDTEGFIANISVLNAHYIVSGHLNRKKADKAVALILELFELVQADDHVLRCALNSGLKDFEDAVQYFCAVKCDADYIITRNIKDFPLNDIPVLTPDEFLRISTFD